MKSALKDIFRFGRILFLRCYFRSNAKPLASFSRPMIIAPHPDDEAFGCAGLIMKTVAEGGNPHVVFLTDGESSLIGYGEDDHQTGENRKAMAVQVADLLGLKPENLSWLHLPDGNLPGPHDPMFPDAVQRLTETLSKFLPDAVFVTHPSDSWPDHIAAGMITRAAVLQMTSPPEFYQYAVWLWYSMKAARVRDISKVGLNILNIREWKHKKKKLLHIYVETKSEHGHPWSGYLPRVFLKAFDWPYEVFEKVNLSD